jgi:hypothetical protein
MREFHPNWIGQKKTAAVKRGSVLEGYASSSQAVPRSDRERNPCPNPFEKEHPMDGKKVRNPLLLGLALILGLMLSTSCSTANWPITSSQTISRGEKAINEAKANNASTDAPNELKAAEEKLSQAKKEFAQGWHQEASRLAEEAAVDAEYARAKATTEKDKKMVKEMQENIETLRQEIERQSK